MVNKLKVLNLYAGIGGNRKLWGDNIDVTAVEINPDIAKIYKKFFPNDKVIIGDAHEYLREHYKEFDFIWTSPPCPSHSRMRMNHKIKIFPDMKLYEEIIFLKHFCKDKIWIVENVIPYYKPLIEPTTIMHRHNIWSNCDISKKEFEKLGTCKIANERLFLQNKLGFNLDNFSGVDKRLLLRNCVVPEMGLHIFKDLLLYKYDKNKLTEMEEIKILNTLESINFDIRLI